MTKRQAAIYRRNCERLFFGSGSLSIESALPQHPGGCPPALPGGNEARPIPSDIRSGAPTLENEGTHLIRGNGQVHASYCQKETRAGGTPAIQRLWDRVPPPIPQTAAMMEPSAVTAAPEPVMAEPPVAMESKVMNAMDSMRFSSASSSVTAV